MLRIRVRACKEIQRVGERGYIEVPSRLGDVFHDYLSIHTWSVSHPGNTLVFRRHEEWERRGTGDGGLLNLAAMKYENYYRWWEQKNYNFLVNHSFWKDRFNCVVIRHDGRVEKYQPEGD